MAISDRRDSERGFTLAALLVILTIISVIVAYSVPTMWSTVLRRERDEQTVFAMRQYARAIVAFQLKRGALPVSLEQLKEQNNPRVLRKVFPCPLTGKDNWILISPGSITPGSPVAGQPAPAPGQPPTGSTPPGGAGTGLSGEYSGPFIGVRPPVSGQSFLSFRGQDRYENWSYTIIDLNQEINPLPPQSIGSRPN